MKERELAKNAAILSVLKMKRDGRFLPYQGHYHVLLQGTLSCQAGQNGRSQAEIVQKEDDRNVTTPDFYSLSGEWSVVFF